MSGLKHEVLFTDNDFRLVRSHRSVGSFIQHHHPELNEAEYNHTSFDWEGWVYCLGRYGKCMECEVKVPKPMSGLMELENWEK